MELLLQTLCVECGRRQHISIKGVAYCPHCPHAPLDPLHNTPGRKAKPRVQGTAEQAPYRHAVAGALDKADHDRLMAVRERMGVSTSQLVTLILLAHLDKLDLAAKYPYSGCPSSAQKAERALRAEAEGAGHAAYHGANGDGKGHGE